MKSKLLRAEVELGFACGGQRPVAQPPQEKSSFNHDGRPLDEVECYQQLILPRQAKTPRQHGYSDHNVTAHAAVHR